MKSKLLIGASALVAIVACNVSFAHADTITTGFGTPPGIPAEGYSGTGIPKNASVYEQISAIPGANALAPQDTVTAALSVTAHGSSNPTPGNDGVNTFTVGTGTSGGRSLWNFDYYVNSAQNRLGGYTFLINVQAESTGKVASFNLITDIPDNVDGPNGAGNSESLDFAFLKTLLSYDPNANETYDVTLDIEQNGILIGDVSEKVVDGTGAVPDNTSTLALSSLAFGGLFLARKKVLKAKILSASAV